MTQRTSSKDIQNWDDVQDLDSIVVDKRSLKRANGEKRRRRNRRYENRLLNVQVNLQINPQVDSQMNPEVDARDPYPLK